MAQTRRTFLQQTGAATAGALLASLEGLTAQPVKTVPARPGYQLKILATNWGFEGGMDAFCAKAKKDGYDGIENWWPGTQQEQDEMFAAVKKHGLDIGFLYGAGEDEPAAHIQTFKKTMDAIARQTVQAPLYINLHSGRDYFNVDDNKKIVEYTLSLAKDTGIPIYHETHRGRMMFAAHITAEYLKKYPLLKLTLDISHWCNVHESMLENQQDAVNAALLRTEHIHARVGYQQGPQVADPRAPEWDYAVKAHLAWWDKVVERKREDGERLTFLTEFGPPLYMQTLPYTLQPLASQWDINVHIMKLLRKRYG
jgi:sugar phosphate isomerase/epimerase